MISGRHEPKPISPSQLHDDGILRPVDAPPMFSLRDWFAGMALHNGLSGGNKPAANLAARYAYEYADAMLAEREKPKT